MDDEKYFGLTPAQLNLAFVAAVGAVALAAFVYFGGVGAVKEYLGEERVAVVETATPAPGEVPAAVTTQEQEEKPAAESDPPPPPPQVGEPPVDPPHAPPKPTPTPEPPKPSVAPYWAAVTGNMVFFYHPNIACQVQSSGNGWATCTSPTEGWTVVCTSRFNSSTTDCVHTRDGTFTCSGGGVGVATVCLGPGGLVSTCTKDESSGIECSRPDGESLTGASGQDATQGAVFYWSGGSFVCVRDNGQPQAIGWTCT